VQVIQIPLDNIQPDPEQPRKFFGKEELQTLADNIAVHGVVEPIIVRTDGTPDTYIIIAGERRWRASRIAGKDTIPGILRDDIVGRQQREVSITENTAREDLNGIEEAKAFSALLADGLTVEEVAKRIGRTVKYVKDDLSLLRLMPDYQRLVETGNLGVWQAVEVAKLSTEYQPLAMRAIVQQGIGFKALQELVSMLLEKQNNTELFTDEQVETRKRDALSVKERYERALDLASVAINSLLDRKTREILPFALGPDAEFEIGRLKAFEKEVARLRVAVEKALAMRKAGLV
jgi:ParB family chromosome partitioning protein